MVNGLSGGEGEGRGMEYECASSLTSGSIENSSNDRDIDTTITTDNAQQRCTSYVSDITLPLTSSSLLIECNSEAHRSLRAVLSRRTPSGTQSNRKLILASERRRGWVPSSHIYI